MSALLDPCLPTAPAPLLHRIVQSVHHASHHAWRYAGHPARVVHLVGPVMENPCRLGVKLAAAGLLALAPQFDAPRHNPPRPVPARTTLSAPVPAFQPVPAFAIGPAGPTGSRLVFGPLDPVAAPPKPENILQPYYAAPGQYEVAPPPPVAEVPEPSTLTCLGAALLMLTSLHRPRRTSCGKVRAGA